MRSSSSIIRFYIMIALVAVLGVVCAVRLFDLQVVKGEDYRLRATQRLVRAYPIAAPRGEILDRNGKPIVENRIGYSIQVHNIDVPNKELNSALYNAAYLAASYGSEIESTFPIVLNESTDKLEYDFSIDENGGTRKVEGVKSVIPEDKESDDEKLSDDKSVEENEDEKDNSEKEIKAELDEWKKENNLTEFSSPEQILDFYRKKYEISSEFSDEKTLTVIAMRYAMEKSGFAARDPYIMARDVDEYVLHQIKEQFMDYPGIDIVIEPVRVYKNGETAAHIMGRTGKIYAEEYAELKDKGYGMNDTIGKDGLEKVLEEYLRGEDGYESVEMMRGGGVTQILNSQAAKPGNYVKLNLDIDLQKEAEKALKNAVEKAVGRNGAGAVIAVDPKNGGVLAMASYPSYDITTFNEDYDSLVKSKAKPLINRVLNGTYSPGSTFKPLTSIAALESGTITPGTYIEDKGKYTYYSDYQPTCLVYSSSGATHGTIDVEEAIGVSCNYFFYEVGRKMGIETINDYAVKFGLGQPTGIELPESKGILASPEQREKANGVWNPGDVLQAAIGQSDNMFTPAQLASYVCTILNKGKRYSLRLVDEVVDYETGNVVHKSEPMVLSDNPISESTYNAVIEGMRNVVSYGTASEAFMSAKYKSAGKTGTAEVPDGEDNVLFVGFAPYENPEIVVAVIIEHGASSGYAASVARSVFDAYMEIKDGEYASDESEADSDNSDTSGKRSDKAIVTPPEREKESEETDDKSNDGSDGESDGYAGARPKAAAPDKANKSSGAGTL